MKMNKMVKGVVFGALMGLIDVIPMFLQNLSWDANLSAFSLWIIAGFLTATSKLKLTPPLKGLVISVLTLIPSAILIGSTNPASLMPIGIMTLILGSLLGYLIDK